MITTTRQWLRRNRTNFAVGLGAIGATYMAGRYAINTFLEAQQRSAGERVAKENLRRRFQQNQEDCVITILELLPTVTENVLDVLPSEKITKELQQKKAERFGKPVGVSEAAPSDISSGTPSAADEDVRSLSSDSYVQTRQSDLESPQRASGDRGKTKLQLWNELKISSITRAFTLLYTVSLLSLLTRIQLNLLGRKNYISSVVAQVSFASSRPMINLENLDDDSVEKAYGQDFETNRRYLTFSWWLLHRGWKQVMQRVDQAVREVFDSVKPTEELTVQELSARILDVRKKVEGASEQERSAQNWLSFLLPSREQEELVLKESGFLSELPPPSQSWEIKLQSGDLGESRTSSEAVSSSLRRLLDETSDLIESPVFTHILTRLLDAGFALLMDQKICTEAFKMSPFPDTSQLPNGTSRVQELESKTAKLALILATVTKEAHKIGHGMPNEYVQAIESVKDLEAFAAVIYSSNFDTATTEGHLAQELLKEPRAAQEPPTSDARAGARSGGVVDTALEGFETIWNKATLKV